MKEIQVTMTELRQNLGSLINQAAFGDDFVILVAHGKPKAAIVGVDALVLLRQVRDQLGDAHTHLDLLTQAAALRAQNRRWQQDHAVEPEDSTETLRRLREETANMDE